MPVFANVLRTHAVMHGEISGRGQTRAVANVRTLLDSAKAILLVDWPSREVPETLALAGYEVHVKGGPAPTDFAAWGVQDGIVTHVPTSKPPDHADIVYFHRPLDELPAIVELAARLGAGTVWRASSEAESSHSSGLGSTPADLVRSMGMAYVEDVDIVAAVRTLGGHRVRGRAPGDG